MSTKPGTPFRIVVTGHDDSGRSTVASDAAPTRVFDDLGEDGLVFFEVWNTRETPAVIDRRTAAADEDQLTLAPPTNGTRIRVLDIPCDRADTDFDAVFENIGGADAHLESARHPSFHRTRSIDYGIVLDGELVLLLDDGETIVRAGDIVVQRGTNHGWVNRTDRPCRIAFILIDGVFGEGLS